MGEFIGMSKLLLHGVLLLISVVDCFGLARFDMLLGDQGIIKERKNV